MKRLTWIDNAKGISILLVIIGHVSGGLTGIWDFNFVYGIHLVMFFLLSGYLAKKANISREWINKKFTRLMVPYFFTCFAIIITDIVNSILLNDDGGAISVITNIIGNDIIRSFFASGAITSFGSIEIGTRIGAIWFLPAMFFAIVIFQYLLLHLDCKKIGIISMVIMLIAYIIARFIWLPFSLLSGMFSVFFLWIGYEIKKENLLDKIKIYHYLIAQLILIWGIYNNYCNVGFVSATMNDILLSIPVGLSGCLLIYGLSNVSDKDSILSYIGKKSLIVLCTHLYAIATLKPYFLKLLDELKLNGNIREWTYIGMHIIFAILSASLLDCLCNKFKNYCIKKGDDERDISIDISRGILIISMIVGHFTIDSELRTIIYSCHMVAFVLFSGYFYKKDPSMFKYIKRLVNGLLVPYFFFVFLVIVRDFDLWSYSYFKRIFIQYTFGMSFARNFFAAIPSVGPVYFILMLFVIRIIYYLLDNIIVSDEVKWGTITLLSLFGTYLGEKGVWLPWSIDVALYLLIFYHIGVSCKRYNILKIISKNHIMYFFLSPIWAYMIYKGGMEIAVRNYGSYGLTILGASAGIFIVYKTSMYISENMPIIRNILRWAGKESIIILIIHTLLNGIFSKILVLQFDPDYIPYMIAMILIQLFVAFCVSLTIIKFKFLFLDKRKGKFY